MKRVRRALDVLFGWFPVQRCDHPMMISFYSRELGRTRILCADCEAEL